MSELSVRPARSGEHQALSQLNVRAKRMWGYDDSFMAAAAKALTVTPEMLETHRSFVAERNGEIVGYCLLADTPPAGEIVHLFAEPEFARNGVGRKLMSAAMARAKQAGCASLEVESDPYAAEFYRRLGGRYAGEAPSEAVAGRTLPVFVFDLNS